VARHPDAEAIYHAADLFRQRCLVDGTSLLWPNHPAWTVPNLDALWDAFIGQPDEGKRSFMEKWRDQLAGQPPDVHRVVATLQASVGQVKRWGGWVLIGIGFWTLVLAIWADEFARIFPV